MPRYECDSCGACCQGPLIVQAEWVDVVREPQLLLADRHYTHMSPTHAIQLLKDDIGRAVTLSCGSPCRFLDQNNRCTIYATRPNDCVEMEAGDEQCQYARKSAGLPPLEPLGDPAQSPPDSDVNCEFPNSKIKGGDPDE